MATWSINESEFYTKFLELYCITKEDFNALIKSCLHSDVLGRNSELEEKIINNFYDYVLLDDSKTLGYIERNEVYEHIQNFWNETLDYMKNEKRIEVENMTNNLLQMENLAKPINPIEAMSTLFLMDNIRFIKTDTRLDFYEQKKLLSLETGHTLFRGLFLEKLNTLDENLLGKGEKVAIQESQWKSFIENLYPDIEFNRYNSPHSFDMAVLNEGSVSFYELKNFFIPEKDEKNPILYFKKKHLANSLEKQLDFAKETKSNVNFFITNTSNLEKMVISLKNLKKLLEKNQFKLSYDELRKYVKTNTKENYKEPIKAKKICLEPKEKDFFDSTIHLFQKGLNFTYLSLQSDCKNREEFTTVVDEHILQKIDTKEELRDLLVARKGHQLKEEKTKILLSYFDTFFDGCDFEDKDMVAIRFKNLKNCINNTLNLKGRDKICLDNTAPYEMYSRNKKFLEVFTQLQMSDNLLHNEKLFMKFLSTAAEKIDIKELKKNLPQGINGKDYIQRIENFAKKNIKLSENELLLKY